MRHFLFSSLLLSCLTLSGCSFLTPHRIDIQQGNLVTQEMFEQLEVGMSMHQVRYIMGTPLVTDTFNPLRWDYLYSIQPGRQERYQQRMSLYFNEQGELIRFTEFK